MPSEDDDQVDLESLQARIDMSMAFTHELVAGWMKESKVSLPSTSRLKEERDLEEHLRRPPRLGVGAAVPESTGVLSRETARLKGRLVGKTGKRQREELSKDATVISDDDDDESRTHAVTKKARVDPFAGKKVKTAMLPPPVPSKATSSLPTPGLDAPANGHPDAARSIPPSGVLTGSSPAKKKKKKHKAAPLSEPPPGTSDRSSVGDTALLAGPDRQPSVDAQPSPGNQVKKPPDSPATATPVKNTSGSSLLNLSGPPVIDVDAAVSPKKKRKRRKKKKTVAEPLTHVNAIVVDDDD